MGVEVFERGSIAFVCLDEVMGGLLVSLGCSRSCGLLNRAFQFVPVFEAVFTSEGVLNVTEHRDGCAVRVGVVETFARIGVAFAQGLEPALGFAFQIIESGGGCELSGHVPSLRCRPGPLSSGPDERSCEIRV